MMPFARSRLVLATALENQDRRRFLVLVVRAVFVALALLAMTIFLGGLVGELPKTQDGSVDFAGLIGAAESSPWAPVLVVGAYVLLNFAGVPQILLIAGTVIVFGPWLGFLYAWGATLVSSSVGFALGHFFGGELLRRFAGHSANAFSSVIGRHGILASAIVRNVPAGPAILVNMAAGVSHISYGKFLLGTALGITPKTLIVAIVGKGLTSFLQSGNGFVLLAIGLLIVVWVVAMIFVRRALQRWRARTLEQAGQTEASLSEEPRDPRS